MITLDDLLKEDINWNCEFCHSCLQALPEVRESGGFDDLVIVVNQNSSGELIFAGYHQKCWYDERLAKSKIQNETTDAI